MTTRRAAAALLACLVAPAVGMAQLQKEDVEGIRNFTQVDASVGCAGATDVEAIPGLAARGYRTIVNLRLSSEPGAAIDESRRAAESAGMAFVHLPLDGGNPDPGVAEAFIDTVTDVDRQPVFINCGSANRVGALWLAKRMLVDDWDEERAVEEAVTIGLSSEGLREFALDYVRTRRP